MKTSSQCGQKYLNDAKILQQSRGCSATSFDKNNTVRANSEQSQQLLKNFQNSSKGDLTKTSTNSDNDVIMSEAEAVQSSESYLNDDCSCNFSKKKNEVVKSPVFVQADDENTHVEKDISVHNYQPMWLGHERLIKLAIPSSLVTPNDCISSEGKTHGDRHGCSNNCDDLAQEKQTHGITTSMEKFATDFTKKILSDFIHDN